MKLLSFISKQLALTVVASLGGMFTVLDPAFGQLWTAATITSSPVWQAVAASADGARMVAAGLFQDEYATYHAPLYVLTNAGASWTPTDSVSNVWAAVASSADGTKLVAAAERDEYFQGNGDGRIYTSTDSGATWTKTSAPPFDWTSVGSSADGTRLVAAQKDYFGGDGSIYISTNSGASWEKTSAPTNGWTSVASSADGTKLAGIGFFLGISPYAYAIYTSSDSGATWRQASAPINDWTAVTFSADGTRLVAVSARYPVDVFSGDGLIYTSLDSGASWTPTSAPTNTWQCVASSADGTRLAAAADDVGDGLIYISTNSGATWTATGAPIAEWSSVALSADGYHALACIRYYNGSFHGLLCTLAPPLPPTPLLSIGLSDARPVLSWLLPSSSFVLQQSSDLAQANWVDVTNQPTFNFANLHNQVTLPSSPGNTFYRLRQE